MHEVSYLTFSCSCLAPFVIHIKASSFWYMLFTINTDHECILKILVMLSI